MRKLVAVAIISTMIAAANPAHATPVFDCTNPQIVARYPAMCPGSPGDPLLTPGNGEPVPGGSSPGLIREILRSIGL